MTFVGALCIMVAFAALIFLLVLLGVHFSVPPHARRGLAHTFRCAVVLGDSDSLYHVHRRQIEVDDLATFSPGLEMPAS